MKRMAVLGGILAVLCFGTWASAALVSITFDESGITAGPTNDRFDGTQITNQYSGLGVTWADTLPLSSTLTGQGVSRPAEFSGSWSTTDQFLYYYGTGSSGTTPVNAPITLGYLADSMSFQYRRPNAAGTMDVQLYLGNTLVYDDPGLSWGVGEGWKTFSYTGSVFDNVVISGSDKFMSDNYTFNTVPIPGALFLFAPGLAALVAVRRRIRK